MSMGMPYGATELPRLKPPLSEKPPQRLTGERLRPKSTMQAINSAERAGDDPRVKQIHFSDNRMQPVSLVAIMQVSDKN